MEPVFSLPESELYNAIQSSLKNWHNDKSQPGVLQNFTLYQQQLASSGETEHGCTKFLLNEGLEALRSSHPQYSHLLSRRYIDDELAHKLANELNLAESTLFRKQKEAIDELVKTLRTLERNVAQSQQKLLMQRLEEPTYTNLIGVDDHLDALGKEILTSGPPWIIALVGMGGVGKTSLADALARRLITEQSISNLGWITARAERLTLRGQIQSTSQPLVSGEGLLRALAEQIVPEYASDNDGNASHTWDEVLNALEEKLKKVPHVVFIDNLETVEEVEELLPHLRHMVNPTKFVLTSREILYGEGDIFHYQIPELSQADSLTLVRHEAKLRNLSSVLSASDQDLLPIWQTVGGNPLALRLVVGQTHIHALNHVLGELQQARGDKSEQLYTYIYRHAWENLDEYARLVLLAMPLLTAHGGKMEALQQITQMGLAEIGQGLEQLVALNLVDSRGGLNNKIFTIHNLTRTFLQEQVAKWTK
ncbi:MAG: NB-ARC domain-containing protein [Chloroflexota bacterium]